MKIAIRLLLHSSNISSRDRPKRSDIIKGKSFIKRSKLCPPDKNHVKEVPDISMQQTSFTKQAHQGETAQQEH